MIKAVVRGIIGGTVGMLIIGLFTNQWIIGAGFCYTVCILASIAKQKRKSEENSVTNNQHRK